MNIWVCRSCKKDPTHGSFGSFILNMESFPYWKQKILFWSVKLDCLIIYTNWYRRNPTLWSSSIFSQCRMYIFLASGVMCQKLVFLTTPIHTRSIQEMGICHVYCHRQPCWRADICSDIPCMALNLSLLLWTPKVSCVTTLQEGTRLSEQVATSTDTERCSSRVLTKGTISCWTILSSRTDRGMYTH